MNKCTRSLGTIWETHHDYCALAPGPAVVVLGLALVVSELLAWQCLAFSDSPTSPIRPPPTVQSQKQTIFPHQQQRNESLWQRRCFHPV